VLAPASVPTAVEAVIVDMQVGGLIKEAPMAGEVTAVTAVVSCSSGTSPPPRNPGRSTTPCWRRFPSDHRSLAATDPPEATLVKFQ
jgi:hypothetical protein